ncbi:MULTISPECIES: hypothetical protein [Mesoplasma]|uniref:Uncharacterized protein n=1 Tax=Mesoplasma florum TaxID=2151 RepID=A0A2R3P7M9_MESFO|nr:MULTISPECIES: hypothetical protein [Mesoplasma]AVN64492.1 hypothetical protein CG003_02350 [Mesoplasma florum]
MLVCSKCKNDILPTHKYIQNSAGTYHLDCYKKNSRVIAWMLAIFIIITVIASIIVPIITLSLS